MGGRGTFASGNTVPYTYNTVGKIGGIKVLKGMQRKHGLPEEAHSSNDYISLHPNGSVKQILLFNSNLTASSWTMEKIPQIVRAKRIRCKKQQSMTGGLLRERRIMLCWT